MDYYQFIAVFASIIALLISFISLHSTGKLQRFQKQFAERELEKANKADIRVQLKKVSRHQYRVILSNAGGGAAKDIHLDMRSKKFADYSPLDEPEKLPVKILNPGSELPFRANLTRRTGFTFEAKWDWNNPDGTSETREEVVSPRG